jgi:hypothetical protein
VQAQCHAKLWLNTTLWPELGYPAQTMLSDATHRLGPMGYSALGALHSLILSKHMVVPPVFN